MARYSKQIAEAFKDISCDYFADLDGHWVTLREGYSVEANNLGARIIHEWTVPEMLAAKQLVVRDRK